MPYLTPEDSSVLAQLEQKMTQLPGVTFTHEGITDVDGKLIVQRLHLFEWGTKFNIQLHSLGQNATEYLTEELKRMLPDGQPLESSHSVFCSVHGVVPLTNANYTAQTQSPDTHWFCPICGPEKYARIIEPYEREDYS